MKLGQKRCMLKDGIVKGINMDPNPNGTMNMVAFINQHTVKDSYELASEEVAERIPNPAQLEGVKEGDKIAVFTDASGEVNLVRKGEWKETKPIMQKSKKDPEKEYDNGVTVIMGKCISAGLVQPKEGQTFAPFFSLNVVTDDHTMHRITINNRNDAYNAQNIENAQKNFAEFLADKENGKDFVPFEGTFITQRAWGEEEKTNGKFTNKERKYSGILNIGNFLIGEFTKAPEKPARNLNSQDRTADEQADYEAAKADSDGFINIPDGIEEDLPFDSEEEYQFN